jgi:hypothetical protein
MGKPSLVVWALPKRRTWLNPIEPHWLHTKKRVCEPSDTGTHPTRIFFTLSMPNSLLLYHTMSREIALESCICPNLSKGTVRLPPCFGRF